MEYNKKITSLSVLQGDKLTLDWDNFSNSPSNLFYEWLDTAIENNVLEPQAMTLATADLDGCISSRVLLVRHVDEDANFYFSTSSVNPTGKALQSNPYANLNFYWKELSQQIIASGKVVVCDEKDSQADFIHRSIGSKSICLVQKQSTPLPSLDIMHQAAQNMKEQLKKDANLINPNWTLYQVIPDKIEFFQGRQTRMHERLIFTRDDNNQWQKEFNWA